MPLRDKIREIVDKEVGDRENNLIGEFSGDIRSDQAKVPVLVDEITDKILAAVDSELVRGVINLGDVKVNNAQLELTPEGKLFCYFKRNHG